MRHWWLLVLVLGLGTSTPAVAQHVLEGVVVDTAGAAVSEATVSLANSSIHTLTTASGRFHLTGLPAGPVDLLVRGIGYAPRRLEGVQIPSEGPIVVALFPPAVRALADLLVQADRTPDLSSDLDALVKQDQVSAQPFLGEDAFRTLTRVPGVQADELSARFRIRGAQYDEVLVRIDGLTLLEPFHLRDLSGTFSVVDGHWIERARVSAAGFGAQYGDATGGVVEFSTPEREDRPDRFFVSVSPTHARLSIRGQDHRWSWLASARRGIPDLVLGAAGQGDAFSPRYMDGMAKLTFTPSEGQEISAHLLAGGDRLRMTQDGGGVVSQASGVRGYGWMRWQAQWSPTLTSETVASVTRVVPRRVVDFLPKFPVGVIDRRAFHVFGLRQDARRRIGSASALTLGAEVQRASAQYDYAFRAPIAIQPDPGAPVEHADTGTTILPVEGTTLSAYLTPSTTIARRLELEAGLRFDRHDYADQSALSPRLRGRLQVNPQLSLIGTWGVYRQTQAIYQLDVAHGDRQWFTQSARQTTAGFAWEPTSGLELAVEGYHRAVRDPWPQRLNLELGFEVVPESDQDDILVSPTRSSARGVDLNLTGHAGERISWRAGYSLSSVADEIEGVWIPRPYDQRHAIALDASFIANRYWTIGGAWQWHSGWPSAAPDFDQYSVQGGRVIPSYHYQELGSERLPSYHRLDVRVRHRTTLGGGDFSVALDLLNVYNRRNIRGVSYDGYLKADRGIAIQRKPLTLVPFVPVLEIGWGF